MVEFSKYVHFGEVERLFIRMVLQFLLCALEAALVLLVQLDAVFHLLYGHRVLLLPDFAVPTVCDVGPTGCDHLIGHLDKQGCHSF